MEFKWLSISLFDAVIFYLHVSSIYNDKQKLLKAAKNHHASGSIQHASDIKRNSS